MTPKRAWLGGVWPIHAGAGAPERSWIREHEQNLLMRVTDAVNETDTPWI